MELKDYSFRKEIISLVIASLVMGFIFTFRDWGYEKFSLNIGLINLFRAFLISFILFSVYLVATKSVAKLHGAASTFKIWGMERFWFSKDAKIHHLSFFGKRFRTFKAGIFFPLLFAFFSNGLIRIRFLYGLIFCFFAIYYPHSIFVFRPFFLIFCHKYFF